MSTIYFEMLHTESLSESKLLEILKTKCIELPNMKTLKKSDLLEIFKRVALPMPQRRYNESRHLGKKLNDLRIFKKISIATEEEQILYECAISKLNNIDSNSDSETSKRFCKDATESSKRMKLSNSSPETNCSLENGLKHKLNNQEVSPQTGMKKRQKIMWP